MNRKSLSYCRRSLSRARWLPAMTMILVGNWIEGAPGATLQELVNGGSLTVGNSRFSNWQVVSSDATSGVLPNLALITVIPLASDPLNPGLQYTTGGQLSVTGINAIDLLFKFRVSADAGSGSYTGHALSMTGITFGSDGGIAFISDEVRSYLGADLGPAVVIADNESGVDQLSASSSFAAQPGVVVSTNVFITGLSSTNSINLSAFTQHFDQNGPLLLAGDYNQNGVVDAADYVVWRKNNGPPDGYDAWRENYGGTASGIGSMVAAGGNATAPEPALVPQLVIAITLFAFGRYRVPRRASDLQSRLYCG